MSVTIDREQVVSDLKRMLVDDLFIEVPEGDLKEEDVLTDFLDSVGGLELVACAETRYSILLADDNALALEAQSIGTFADFVMSKLNGRV